MHDLQVTSKPTVSRHFLQSVLKGIQRYEAKELF